MNKKAWHKNPTARRWMTVVIYGVLAAILWEMVEPWVLGWSGPFTSHLASWRYGLGILSLLFMGGVIAYLITKRQGLGFWGLRHFFSYPPLWVSVFIALFIIYLPNNLLGIGLSLFICTTWFALAITLIESVPSIYSDNKPNTDSDKKPAPQLHEIDTFEKLQIWFDDDNEINTPNDDQFGHNEIALRIVQRLATPPGQKPSSIALIGPLGSGKTSIGRLVKYHLSKQRDIRHIQLSLWQYHTPEAAVSGILNSLINELGNEVDTLSITGLPDAYLKAIEKSRSPFSGLAPLLGGIQQPEDILKKIGSITEATSITLVLWIEDLERYAGTGQEDCNDEQIRWLIAEKLDPLRALLYLLDKQDGISVVIADTSLNSRFDLQKIARYIEQIPTLGEKGILSTVKPLMDCHINSGQSTPSIPEAEKWLPESLEDMEREIAINLTSPTPSLFSAFTTLCDTPRNLKMVLRLTHEMWEKLKREVDDDDLLLINLIRIMHPTLFSSIVDNIEKFQKGFENDPLRQASRIKRLIGDEAPYSAYSSVGSKVTEDSNMDRDWGAVVAYKTIIQFLFPKSKLFSKEEYPSFNKPKGIRHLGRWQIYINERLDK